MLIKEAVKLDRKWVRLISLLFTYTQLVKLGNTLSVYLEHDLPDTKFASVVADCLQSLGLFDVIVSDCERIADLDMIKKAKLENCNIFVLLLGTVSSKLPLIYSIGRFFRTYFFRFHFGVTNSLRNEYVAYRILGRLILKLFVMT